MKQKIIVTGFGPFRGHDISASWESVKLLPNLWNHDQIDVVIEEIPVNYEFVQNNVPEKWADLKPKPMFYVHVGVSHIAKKVTLETIGHNTCYSSPDVVGACPKNNWYFF